MIIIGISGKAGTGKDKLARFMTEEFSSTYKIKKYAFADALKEEVAGKEFELCVRYNLPLHPEPDGKWRKLLQYYGELKRKESLYYWVLKVSRAIDEDAKKGLQVAIVSDVRRKNEAMFIKSRGGSLIRVECSDLVKGENWRQDISEIDLDRFKFDYTVTNAVGDLESLRQDARAVFSMIRDELDLVGFMKRQIEEEEAPIFPTTEG
jgi:hypothetical protein